jgi:hypothetical protein
MSLNVAVRSRSLRDNNVILAPFLYARIRLPSYFSSKIQLGRWKGFGTRSANIGRMWMEILSITTIYITGFHKALSVIRFTYSTVGVSKRNFAANLHIAHIQPSLRHHDYPKRFSSWSILSPDRRSAFRSCGSTASTQRDRNLSLPGIASRQPKPARSYGRSCISGILFPLIRLLRELDVRAAQSSPPDRCVRQFARIARIPPVRLE